MTKARPTLTLRKQPVDPAAAEAFLRGEMPRSTPVAVVPSPALPAEPPPAPAAKTAEEVTPAPPPSSPARAPLTERPPVSERPPVTERMPDPISPPPLAITPELSLAAGVEPPRRIVHKRKDGREMLRTTVWMEAPLADRLALKAAGMRVDQAWIINRALAEWLERNGG